LINAHVVAITDKSYRVKEAGDQLRKPRKAENPTNRRAKVSLSGSPQLNLQQKSL